MNQHVSTSFAERLRRGDKLLAASVATSPVNAEILGDCGFDWLFVDAETLPLSMPDIQDIIRAAQTTPAAAVVRMNNDAESDIRQVLDMGAAGVIIPLVRSSDQAAAIVAAAKYPPVGLRGLAGGRAQGYGYGPSMKDYIGRANVKTAAIVMVEESDGLDAVEEIAAVTGLDGIFVGPGDLSMSLGCFGDHMHADMQAAYQRIGNAAQAHGIAAGVYPSSREMYEFCFAQGFRFFLAGLDTAFIRAAGSSRLEEFKQW